MSEGALRRRSPDQLGITAGAPLDPVGRAVRWRAEVGPAEGSIAPGHEAAGHGATGHEAAGHEAAGHEAASTERAGYTELWKLPGEDEGLGRRLLTLGGCGVGGFVDGGVDDEGVWLLRRLAGRALAERLRERRGPFPYREALGVGLALARALAACEKASLFPGPLTPDGVMVEDHGGAAISAAALMGALVGAAGAGARASHEVSPLWTPPAQADGAMWDSAANRYALGLVLYRLLAGEHPFSGAGLRHALGEAAHREAPPFAEEVAAALPAGLQSLVLRMLDPDPARRPCRAQEVADALRGFLEGEAAGSRRAASVPPGARSGASTRPPPAGGSASTRPPPGRAEAAAARRAAARPVTWRDRAWQLAPLVGGLGVAVGAITLIAPAPEPPGRRPANPVGVAASGRAGNGAPSAAPTVAAERPLAASETAAQDCAACHSRQAGEWRRSVMAHSVRSPLFNALESLIEEQVGRDFDCPNGAGILRRSDPSRACRDRKSGVTVTGSGGEHWCVNCHSPADNLDSAMPAWDGRPGGEARARHPVRDLLTPRGMEGISCGFCHQVHGPVGARGSRGYQGNPTWTSFVTGAVFAMRPEDVRGLTGIGNSGYELRAEELLAPPGSFASPAAGPDDPVVHRRPSASAKAYLKSSEFCGACHDVRLFGTDSLGAARGEHFKRLRNAYSEWAAWARTEERAGREAASCQDCHMSTYPGVCVAAPGAPGGEGCPAGTRFEARKAGALPRGRVADGSAALREVSTHYFSGVDVPLSEEFPGALVDEATVDLHGIPTGARQRRDLLLRHTFRFGLGAARRSGNALEIPVEVENTGAGHRVPAGFSQEREFWVHLVVRDGDGKVLYEVGRVDRGDEDLHDKDFVRVNTRPDRLDAQGRPEGLFGADVRDGPDAPRWSPPPLLGGTSFRGRGLINFQNGFLRCVRCIGVVAPDGSCQPGPGQGVHHADRFEDGDYDIDTGECRSNLSGMNAFFETFFPVGALDASRGLVKGPDSIIDTRSVPPGVPLRYTYDLPTNGRRGPFRVEARLLFRAFPPFLIKAFAGYEREQARRGLRPSGPLVSDAMLDRLEVVELGRAEAELR